MRTYWTRIGLAAAGVFLAGLFVVTLARQGVAFVQGQVASYGGEGVLSLPFAVGSFRLNGKAVGTYRRLEFNRGASSMGGRVLVTVQLDDRGMLESLVGCDLLMDDGDFGPQSSFGCLTEADRIDGRVVQVGRITFMPEGLTRPVFVPADGRQAGRWSGRQGRSVETIGLVGSDGGALIVQDRAGQAVLSLMAGIDGGVLRIRNGQGREVLRISPDGWIH